MEWNISFTVIISHRDLFYYSHRAPFDKLRAGSENTEIKNTPDCPNGISLGLFGFVLGSFLGMYKIVVF